MKTIQNYFYQKPVVIVTKSGSTIKGVLYKKKEGTATLTEKPCLFTRNLTISCEEIDVDLEDIEIIGVNPS